MGKILDDEMQQDLPFSLRTADKLRSAIFMALGEASMCWDRTPQGVFDSQLAIKVGELLYWDIVALLLKDEP